MLLYLYQLIVLRFSFRYTSSSVRFFSFLICSLIEVITCNFVLFFLWTFHSYDENNFILCMLNYYYSYPNKSIIKILRLHMTTTATDISFRFFLLFFLVSLFANTQVRNSQTDFVLLEFSALDKRVNFLFFSKLCSHMCVCVVPIKASTMCCRLNISSRVQSVTEKGKKIY